FAGGAELVASDRSGGDRRVAHDAPSPFAEHVETDGERPFATEERNRRELRAELLFEKSDDCATDAHAEERLLRQSAGVMSASLVPFLFRRGPRRAHFDNGSWSAHRVHARQCGRLMGPS